MEDLGSAKGQSTEFQGVSLIEEKETEEELFFQTPRTLFNTSTRTLSKRTLFDINVTGGAAGIGGSIAAATAYLKVQVLQLLHLLHQQLSEQVHQRTNCSSHFVSLASAIGAGIYKRL